MRYRYFIGGPTEHVMIDEIIQTTKKHCMRSRKLKKKNSTTQSDLETEHKIIKRDRGRYFPGNEIPHTRFTLRIIKYRSLPVL